jgi:hypothetical protein
MPRPFYPNESIVTVQAHIKGRISNENGDGNDSTGLAERRKRTRATSAAAPDTRRHTLTLWASGTLPADVPWLNYVPISSALSEINRISKAPQP